MTEAAHPPIVDFSRLVDAVDAGVLVIDRALTVVVWNRWLADHSGVPAGEALGKRLADLFPRTDLTALERRVQQVLLLGSYAFFDPRVDAPLLPMRHERALTSPFLEMQLEVVLAPLGEPGGELVCLTLRDATQVMAAEQQLAETNLLLEKRSRRDDLTGLYNRGFVLEVLEREAARCQRHGTELTIALADLDRFKRVNDAHGHQAGDRVLASCASLLREAVRATDVVGRYGGEEFIIVMPDTALDAGRAVAERIRQAVAAETVAVGSLELTVTISCGVAASRPPHEVDALLARADHALYEAKRAGRDRVMVGA